MYSKYLLNINENNIINLVAGDNYIIVNRTLIKNLGLKEAVILGELASEFNYYKKNNSLDENGYFYSTIENIEENTGLSRSQQKTVLDKLKELEIIDVIVKGIPAKRYIKIDVFRLISQYAEKLQTSLLKTDKLECQKLTSNNNNKNNKNKEIHKESYGEYKRIKLTPEEYGRLVKEFGESFIKQQIDLLDEYIESNNNKNKYTNFNLVLRKSIRENWFNRKKGNDIVEWF